MRPNLWIAVLFLAACAGPSPQSAYETLRADGEPLRSAFDEAAGTVRAIFLASPT